MSSSFAIETAMQEAGFIGNPIGRETNKTSWLFMCCLAIILSVSVYDTYLVVLHKRHIHQLERNPICLALIEMEPDGLSFFVLGKILGNLGVISVLGGLKWIRFRHYLTIAKTVAGFQLFLLAILLFSDSKTGILSFDNLYSHDRTLFFAEVRNLLYHLAAMLGISVLLVAGAWSQRRRQIRKAISCT